MLNEEFPRATIDPSWGQWWRIHSAEHGPWWFSSSDEPRREEASIGRFDLPAPSGTCYLGAYLDANVAEVLREPGVAPAEAQEAAEMRCISAMPLDRWYERPIADFTGPKVEEHDAPADIASLERSDARPWAEAAHRAGFGGILYRLREDPKRRCGLALFGDSGEHPPVGQPPPFPLPVGLRREFEDLFDGELRGDPLPR